MDIFVVAKSILNLFPIKKIAKTRTVCNISEIIKVFSTFVFYLNKKWRIYLQNDLFQKISTISKM